MPNTSAISPSKKSVQFNDQTTVHIVENWKQFNVTPKELKTRSKSLKVEKVVIRTDLENYVIEKYNKFKIAVKELTNSCSFI